MASAKEAQEREKEARALDLRYLMGLPAFERWFQHLMAITNTFGLTETLQANQDFRAQARRGVGLEVCAALAQADRKKAAELFAKTFTDVLTPPQEQSE